jgi:flagellar motor switch protein FliG
MKALASDRFTNRQKAAVLMVTLDVEAASTIMKQLTSKEIEAITVEITNLKGIPSAAIDAVVEEFHTMFSAQQYIVEGGLEHAQRILENSVGFSKAVDIMEKVKSMMHVKGFAVLKDVDAQQLASFLQKEHSQTIALILSNLSNEQAAKVLQEFPAEIRQDIVFRMATLGKVSPSLLTEMESVIESISETELSQIMSSMGGTKAVAAILNKLNNATAKSVMEFIETKEPNLAQEIKRLMFLFEDLIYVDDRSIQRILREVDKKDLALSLKVSDDKLKKKIFQNMSERAQELVKEELQYLGPVRLKDVETAQTRIVEIVKMLEDQGEIVVAGRGGAEEVFV